MIRMRCLYCNSKIERKWNFCPKCGRRAEKKFGLFDIFSKIFSNEYEPTRAHEITINLSSDFDHPMISVKPTKISEPILGAKSDSKYIPLRLKLYILPS